MMILYAAGFNAWSQLNFDTHDNSSPASEPEDLVSFKVILEGNSIETPISTLTSTIILKDDAILQAGSQTSHCEIDCLDQLLPAQNSLGEILVAQPCNGSSTTNGKHQQLSKFASLTAYKNNDASQSWPCEKQVKHITAFEVGWAILYQDGAVSTLGDPRFGDCLGREIASPTSFKLQPADTPGEVTDLSDLHDPVTKIVAGGYAVGALTESGSLYAWGMTSPPGTHRQRHGLPGLSSVPNYVEVQGDVDVVDVGLGESHAIALTEHGTVWVIGGNTNGQLGLGLDYTERTDEWTQVNLHLPSGHRVVQVAAGPRASFIMVAADETQSDL